MSTHLLVASSNKATFYNHTENLNGTFFHDGDDIVLEAIPGLVNQTVLAKGFISVSELGWKVERVSSLNE